MGMILHGLLLVLLTHKIMEQFILTGVSLAAACSIVMGVHPNPCLV